MVFFIGFNHRNASQARLPQKTPEFCDRTHGYIYIYVTVYTIIITTIMIMIIKMFWDMFCDIFLILWYLRYQTESCNLTSPKNTFPFTETFTGTCCVFSSHWLQQFRGTVVEVEVTKSLKQTSETLGGLDGYKSQKNPRVLLIRYHFSNLFDAYCQFLHRSIPMIPPYYIFNFESLHLKSQKLKSVEHP